MNTLITFLSLSLFAGAFAQYEAGFVKILEDQRYQDGASFGNYRHQEDGIKYKEETDPLGVRRGFWEYPEQGTGRIVRVEFEAGSGIGFRIVNSNVVAPTPIAAKTPTRVAAQPRPVHQARKPVHQAPRTVHHEQAVPVWRAPTTTTPRPGPQHLFDYPAELQFFRNHDGHRFKFTAV